MEIPPEVSEWGAGIQFGIAYAYERSPNLGAVPRPIRVRVTNVEGHDVDTTEVVIAYAAAHASRQALNEMPSRGPSFDPATGMFNFPK